MFRQFVTAALLRQEAFRRRQVAPGVLAVSAHFSACGFGLTGETLPFFFEECCSLQRRLAFSLFVLPVLFRWRGGAELMWQPSFVCEYMSSLTSENVSF